MSAVLFGKIKIIFALILSLVLCGCSQTQTNTSLESEKEIAAYVTYYNEHTEEGAMGDFIAVCYDHNLYRLQMTDENAIIEELDDTWLNIGQSILISPEQLPGKTLETNAPFLRGGEMFYSNGVDLAVKIPDGDGYFVFKYHGNLLLLARLHNM